VSVRAYIQSPGTQKSVRGKTKAVGNACDAKLWQPENDTHVENRNPHVGVLLPQPPEILCVPLGVPQRAVHDHVLAIGQPKKQQK
jgi:hypothetical protein